MRPAVKQLIGIFLNCIRIDVNFAFYIDCIGLTIKAPIEAANRVQGRSSPGEDLYHLRA
jgi:hypothetical protein